MSTQTEPAAVSSERVLDFRPTLPMRWEISRTAAESDGALFETVNCVGPGVGGPPVHVHAQAEETYAVLEGELEVLLDHSWTTVRAGEKATVPPGTRHTLRNASSKPVRFVNGHRPALRFEQMFRDFNAIIQSGKVKSLPPKDPRSLLYAALFFVEYADVQLVTSPPQPVLGALAKLARLIGMRLQP